MKYIQLDALEQLLGCYLHQDWPDEFDSDASALQAMVAIEPRPQISAGIDEINHLLDAELSENDLRLILNDQVGCHFEPGSAGLSYREWLAKVRATLLQR